MSRRQEFIGVRCIEAANVYGEGQHLYNMHLTDTEIIRCRDCKHVKLKFLRCKKSFTPIFAENGKQIGFEESRIDPDGFCAWAERDANE